MDDRRGQVGLTGWLVGWRPCRVTATAASGATERAGVWLSHVFCGCTSKSGFWKFATKNVTISNRIDRISILSIEVFRPISNCTAHSFPQRIDNNLIHPGGILASCRPASGYYLYLFWPRKQAHTLPNTPSTPLYSPLLFLPFG